MESGAEPTGRRLRRLRLSSAVAATVGPVLAVGLPWVRTVVLGTRPYVTSAFDVGSFAGWLLMLVGLAGVRATFGDRFGRLGRASVATTAAGMALVSALLFRRVVLFVGAGFRAVPATGGSPADLPLSLGTVLGVALTLVGAGGLGVALRRIERRPTVTPWLLLSAPAVPTALLAFDLLFGLPPALGRLLVGTSAALVPFGVGWLALGTVVWSRARSRG